MSSRLIVLVGPSRSRNAAFTYLGNCTVRVLSALALIVTTPRVLGALGEKNFGIWAAVMSITTNIGFLDFGLGNSLVSRLVPLISNSETDSAKRTIGSASWVLTVIGATSVPFVILGLGNWTKGALDQAQSGAYGGLVIAGTCLGMGLALSAIPRVQLALQEGYITTIFQAFGVVIGTCFILLASSTRLAIAGFIAASLSGPCLGSIANWWYCLYRQCPTLRPALGSFDRKEARLLLSSGVLYAILALCQQAAFYWDPAFVLRLLGSQAAAQTAIISRFYQFSFVLTLATAPLWAAVSDAVAHRDYAWVSRVVRRLVLTSGLFTGLLSCFLIAVGPLIAERWLSGRVHLSRAAIAAAGLTATVQAIAGALSIVLYLPIALKRNVVYSVLATTAAVAAKTMFGKALGLPGILLSSGATFGAIYLPFAVFTVRCVVRREMR